MLLLTLNPKATNYRRSREQHGNRGCLPVSFVVRDKTAQNISHNYQDSDISTTEREAFLHYFA